MALYSKYDLIIHIENLVPTFAHAQMNKYNLQSKDNYKKYKEIVEPLNIFLMAACHAILTPHLLIAIKFNR